MSLIGWVTGDGDIGEAVTKSIFPQGPLGSHESGGYTANIPTNRVAGVVHGKEWVANAAQTAKYRPLFDMIMAGTLEKSLQTPAVIPRLAMAQLPSVYADSVAGGLRAVRNGAGTGADIPPPQIQVINTTGQPTSQKQTTGAGGESITQIIIGKVAADIAAGGQVAKTLQANYGLSRTGVRRG
jgi:hypothetical protein